jgi:hypothetical protein
MAMKVCEVGLSPALDNSKVNQHHPVELYLSLCHLLKSDELGHAINQSTHKVICI